MMLLDANGIQLGNKVMFMLVSLNQTMILLIVNKLFNNNFYCLSKTQHNITKIMTNFPNDNFISSLSCASEGRFMLFMDLISLVDQTIRDIFVR